MQRAETFLRPYVNRPTKLPAGFTTLAARPKPGTVIKLVNGSIPSDNDTYNQQAIAARAIGWTAKKIVFNGTVEDLNSKFDQAVAAKPTAITLSGWPAASIQAPLAAAKRAGIIVVLGNVTDAPGASPGLAAVVSGSPSYRLVGEIQAYMFMKQSNCAGNVAIFNLPFPILNVSTDAFQSTVRDNCPQCVVSYNDIQAKDMGTPTATNAIVSKLQSSPSTKFLYVIIGNLADGLSSALTQAGISGINIFGQVPDPNSIAALRNRTNAWWLNQSSMLEGWVELDAALRVLETGKPLGDPGDFPLYLLTPENVGTGTGSPVGPADFQAEFERLWHAA